MIQTRLATGGEYVAIAVRIIQKRMKPFNYTRYSCVCVIGYLRNRTVYDLKGGGDGDAAGDAIKITL